MAYIYNIFCPSCQQTKQVAVDSYSTHPTMCNECLADKLKNVRAKHFTELDCLTLEERVRRIEEWIYDFKFPVNITDVRF